MPDHIIPPASELDDDAVLAEQAPAAVPDAVLEGPLVADQRRWGFIEDGAFVPLPKIPLALAGLEPPCTVRLFFGERQIVAEPEGQP